MSPGRGTGRPWAWTGRGRRPGRRAAAPRSCSPPAPAAAAAAAASVGGWVCAGQAVGGGGTTARERCIFRLEGQDWHARARSGMGGWGAAMARQLWQAGARPRRVCVCARAGACWVCWGVLAWRACVRACVLCARACVCVPHPGDHGVLRQVVEAAPRPSQPRTHTHTHTHTHKHTSQASPSPTTPLPPHPPPPPTQVGAHYGETTKKGEGGGGALACGRRGR